MPEVGSAIPACAGTLRPRVDVGCRGQASGRQHEPSEAVNQANMLGKEHKVSEWEDVVDCVDSLDGVGQRDAKRKVNAELKATGKCRCDADCTQKRVACDKHLIA